MTGIHEPLEQNPAALGLSKSRIAAFEQCRRRFWLQVHLPQAAATRQDSAKERLKSGAQVGAVARTLVPNGALVDADPNMQAALDRTAELIALADRPIFEATLEHGGVLVRIDILNPVCVEGEQAWELIEVKDSTSCKLYHISDVAPQLWVAEKLAVFLARRIATDPESLMKGRVAVAPVNDFASAATISKSPMKISFAVIVGGILRLISSNPKEDANKLKMRNGLTRLSLPEGRPPLRELYRIGDDAFLYAATRNFLNACHTLFWDGAPSNSFILKTVGVQALFDIFRELAKDMYEAGDMTEEAFIKRLEPGAGVDFSDQRFQNASGSNRTVIRRILRVRLGLLNATNLPAGDERFL